MARRYAPGFVRNLHYMPPGLAEALAESKAIYAHMQGPGLMTEAELEDAKTPNGGYTRAQFEAWGEPWPPQKGWKYRLTHPKLPMRD